MFFGSQNKNVKMKTLNFMSFRDVKRGRGQETSVDNNGVIIWLEEGDKTIKMDRWTLCQGIPKKVARGCLRHLIVRLPISSTWCSLSSSLLQVLNHSTNIEWKRRRSRNLWNLELGATVASPMTNWHDNSILHLFIVPSEEELYKFMKSWTRSFCGFPREQQEQQSNGGWQHRPDVQRINTYMIYDMKCNEFYHMIYDGNTTLMYKESIYMIYDKRLKYITYNKRCTAGTSIGERLTTAFTECSPALMRWGGGGGHWILFLFWYSVFCLLPIFVNFHFFYALRSGRRWRGSSSLAVMTSATGIDIIWKPW